MSKKYIAIKPLVVNGKKINPGKQIKGLNKRRLNVLINHGYINISYGELKYIAIKDLVVNGQLIKIGEEIQGLDKNRLDTLIKYRRAKAVEVDGMDL